MGLLRRGMKTIAMRATGASQRPRLPRGSFRAPVCAGQQIAKPKPEQRPHLVDGMLAGDLAADLCIEVLGRNASRFAGDGEAVAQDQDAEGQEAQSVRRCARSSSIQRSATERRILDSLCVALRSEEHTSELQSPLNLV